MLNLSTSVKFKRVSDAVAAATADVESASLDTQGFGAAMFCVAMGAVNAGNVVAVKAQQSSDDGVADGWSDLEGTSISVADDADDDLVLLDIVRPQKRYVRCVVEIGTVNAVVDAIIGMLYDPIREPVTHDASVAASEQHFGSAEGTA